jgi:hypothetical protein
MRAPLPQSVKATYGVARLLDKDLSQIDHGLGAQLLGKIHHSVRVILLVTRPSASEKGTKGVDRYGVALLGTSRLLLITEIKH